MTDQPGSHADDRAAKLDRALAETQRAEREERNADISRQAQTDEKIIEALAGDVPHDG